MARRTARDVQQFSRPLPLKDHCDIFLFTRRPCEFSKPRSKSPRKAREENNAM
jgi:hypothetical protein